MKKDKISIEIFKKNLEEEGEIILKIKVLPKSSKQEIVEIMDDNTIKIKLTATPEKNKANEELILFLSDYFKVSKENIKILKGHKSPLKHIKIKT